MGTAFLSLASLVIAASASLATSVSALTMYPGAARVRVTSATGSFIQLAEISVSDGNAINWAAASNGGTAHSLNQFDAGSDASNAIYGTTGSGASGIYRSLGTVSDYLDITLGRRITLSSITLYGRTDAAAGNLFDVQVFDVLGRSLFAGSIDARYGPRTDWFDVIGVPVVPGPLPLTSGGAQIGAIPEPASWTLLVTGFGLLGASVPRRRGNTVTA